MVFMISTCTGTGCTIFATLNDLIGKKQEKLDFSSCSSSSSSAPGRQQPFPNHPCTFFFLQPLQDLIAPLVETPMLCCVFVQKFRYRVCPENISCAALIGCLRAGMCWVWCFDCLLLWETVILWCSFSLPKAEVDLTDQLSIHISQPSTSQGWNPKLTDCGSNSRDAVFREVQSETSFSLSLYWYIQTTQKNLISALLCGFFVNTVCNYFMFLS